MTKIYMRYKKDGAQCNVVIDDGVDIIVINLGDIQNLTAQEVRDRLK